MEGLPPAALVTNLINSHAIARVVHVIAELGVADALADKPATATQLAAISGMNADALERMLRLLTAYGVFAREAGEYIHNDASRLLCSDHPQSLRPFARMVGMPALWNGFTDLGHAAKTGRPATDWPAMVEYFSQHPDEAALFDRAMTSRAANVIPQVLNAYDFSNFVTIADVGGGRGHFIQSILERYSSATGILFDLPHVLAALPTLESDSLQLQSGDFFHDPLPVADAYVLMEVIHDWDDSDAARILTAIRRSAPNQARVVIVEAIISDEPGPHLGKTLDVIMLAVTGGRERTRSDYERILESAGFRLQRCIPTASQFSIVEAVIAD